MARNGTVGLYDSSLFSFWGASVLLCIVVVLIYIPTNSVYRLIFPLNLTNICCCDLDDSHSDWSEVKSQCHFAISFMAGMLSISSCIYWSFVLIPLKFVQFICLFLIG
jgi:hypothetical protein